MGLEGTGRLLNLHPDYYQVPYFKELQESKTFFKMPLLPVVAFWFLQIISSFEYFLVRNMHSLCKNDWYFYAIHTSIAFNEIFTHKPRKS